MTNINKVDNSQLDYVEALIAKAFDAEQRNTEEAMKITYEALDISITNGFIKQEARSYLRIGRCHWISSNFKEAIEFLGKSLELTDRTQDLYTKVEALIGLGNVYITMELIDQAMGHYHNALEIAMEHGFGELESKLLNNIGTMHEDLKDYFVALDYYQKCLEKSLELKDNYAIAIANVNIGNVYINIDRLDEAKKSISTAIKFGVENRKNLLLAHSYHSMGRIHQKYQDYSQGIKYLMLGADEAKESKDMVILFRIYVELASSYDSLNDFVNAKDYFNKAFDLSGQIGMVELNPRLFEQMAIFYEKYQDHEMAFKYYKDYLNSSKIVEENRRLERIKSIEFQSRLSASQEETKIYRQLSNELKKSYQQMHVLSEIGQTMTSTHVLSDIFEKLYENVNLLMSAESVGVGLYDASLKGLRFDLLIEKGKVLDSFSLSLENEKSYHVFSFLNKQTLVINDFEKEFKRYLKGSSSVHGDPMHSAMYAPLISEGEVIGVFSIQTREKNAYTETHKDLLQTLASYLAIAIKNATRSKELAVLNGKLKAMSEQDGLTGIPNRRLFDSTYDRLWNEAIENQSDLSIFMIDVDNFKNFNDHYGHLTGDEVIKKVARLLSEKRRSLDDFVARYGGDEFVMLLPNCSLDQASEHANRIKDSINLLNDLLSIKAQIAVSIGVATTTPSATKSKDRFISLSDVQLYISKEKGKNQISAINY